MIAFFQRSIHAIFGLLNTILIFVFLDQNYQGWFITFLSISSIYYVFEMGLNFILINLSTKALINTKYEKNGKLIGEESKYIYKILNKFIKIYFLLSFLYFISIFYIGSNIFEQKSINDTINWFNPWLSLVLLISINFLLQPFIYLIEASNNIKSIYKLRICQTILSTIVFIILLLLETKLWASIAWPLTTLILNLTYLFKNYSNLIYFSFINNKEIVFTWKRNILPLQYKTSVSFISLWITTQLFTPIIFYNNGPISAGKIGISITIANMCMLLSQSHIIFNNRKYINFFKSENYNIKKIFIKDFIISSLIYLLLCLFIIFLIFYLFNQLISNRFVNFTTFCLIFIFFYTILISSTFELLFRISEIHSLKTNQLISALLTIFTVYNFSKSLSLEGIFLVVIFIQIILIPVSIGINLKKMKSG